jgi:cell division protein ZapE
MPSNTIIRLTERDSAVNPEALVAGFVPPPRFGQVAFTNYLANASFPSQAQAKERLQAFAMAAQKPSGFALFRKKPRQQSLYLDGGFGVGKTHLLAATWHQASGQKAFLSFQELVFTIGALRMERAVAVFRGFDLIGIDEFELDDVGNTLMVCMFLSHLLPLGTRVVTTSNTIPGQLGLGRFNADDFKREIASIAAHFETVSLDGPDYRQREQAAPPKLLTKPLLLQQAAQDPRPKAIESFHDLNQHLAKLHPIRFRSLLDDLAVVYLHGLATIESQDVALRFVHFIDKLYDRQIELVLAGGDGDSSNDAGSEFTLDQLFPASYANGGYGKKYARCLSRLAELLRENTTG